MEGRRLGEPEIGVGKPSGRPTVRREERDVRGEVDRGRVRSHMDEGHFQEREDLRQTLDLYVF